MCTVVLRSEDALKSRFHANAFGYRPPPPPPPQKRQPPPMNPHRRKPPPPARPAADAVAPPSTPPRRPNRTCPALPSRSPRARTGRKSRPAAGAGKENGGGAAADELRHHRRRLVMEEVTILKRGEALKPSAPVAPGSNGGDDPSISATAPIEIHPKKLGFPAVDPVYAGPGFSVFSPPPSSLPHPGPLLRPLAAASEEATRSLLRLLRFNQFAAP